MQQDPLATAPRPRLQALIIAFATAFTASLFSFVLSAAIYGIDYELGRSANRTVTDIAFLIFGLVLVASDPVRSGITSGTKENSGKALAVCCVIIGGVLAYRFILDGGAFESWNASWSIWAISPVAQELVFSGFILGILNEYFPRWWHDSIPVSVAVVVTAGLFGMWHFIPDLIFGDGDLSWLFFRQAYTAVPWVLYAMTRLWTGTILYAVAMHVAVNLIILGL